MAGFRMIRSINCWKPTEVNDLPDGDADFAVEDFAGEAGASGSVAMAAPAMAVETRIYGPIADIRPPEVTS
jgi:hypothetical protein